MHGVDCDHSRVIFAFLREGIGYPRESPHAHSHGQVMALDIETETRP
jgi:hypothetical protein